MSRLRAFVYWPLAGVLLAVFSITAATQDRAERPPRDAAAQKAAQAQPPKGRISGRVLAADTGRPLRRARVLLSAPQLPEGRGALTDDNGTFELNELPEGRYSLTVSKTGFVSLSYGQRRPLQPGTPIQLADGQQLAGIDFRLPRGGVIAGRVFDESGDPAPGVNVRAMQYRYAQGNRQLVPAGTAQTDDQGSYRIWGLNPGDYYVSAVARNFNPGGRGFAVAVAQGLAAAGQGSGLANAQFQAFGNGTPNGDSDQLGYAPTFYPGVPTVNDARPVRVSIGGESSDVSFGLLLVRTARVAGKVMNADGTPTTNGVVSLTSESGGAGRGGRFAGNLGARIQWDGTFAIAGVPPGRYTLRVRGDATEVPQHALQPLAVADNDLANLTIVLTPGGSISGTVTLQPTQSAQPPDVGQLRIVAPATDFVNVGPNPNSRVDRDGKFTIEGVPAGFHWIRAQGSLRGWVLKSVLVDARDVIDSPIELRSGQKLTNVTLVLTDRLSEISGTLTDERGNPITEYTVLVFPADSSLWRPQARQVVTARPDQNGTYQIRGLPAGDYFIAAIDPSEPGEWFDPAFLDQQRGNAARLTLGDGDVKAQDFRLSVR